MNVYFSYCHHRSRVNRTKTTMHSYKQNKDIFLQQLSVYVLVSVVRCCCCCFLLYNSRPTAELSGNIELHIFCFSPTTASYYLANCEISRVSNRRWSLLKCHLLKPRSLRYVIVRPLLARLYNVRYGWQLPLKDMLSKEIVNRESAHKVSMPGAECSHNTLIIYRSISPPYNILCRCLRDFFVGINRVRMISTVYKWQLATGRNVVRATRNNEMTDNSTDNRDDESSYTVHALVRM